MRKRSGVRKSNTYAVIVQIILLIAMLAIIGPFIAGLKLELNLLHIFAAILTASIVSINVHEAGHLVLGLLSGHRLLSYQIFFLNWTNQNGKLKFSLRSVKGVSGYCAMVPPGGMPLKMHAAYFAGGITANILTGALSVLLIALLPVMPDFSLLLLTLLAALSFYLALVNLMPLYSVNNPSDGMILWNILLKRPLTNKLIEYNEMIARLLGGMRPGAIDMPADDGDDGFILQSLFKLYRYFKALDSGDNAGASAVANWLEENLDGVPSAMLPPVYYELCYTGCVENDAVKAKAYFDKAGRVLKNDTDANGLRIKAYYAYHVEHNREKALELCEKALAVADRFPIRGQGMMEEALVLKLREEIIKKAQVSS